MENPGLAATVTSGVGTKNMGSVRQYPMPSQHLRHSLEDKALQPSIFVLSASVERGGPERVIFVYIYI